MRLFQLVHLNSLKLLLFLEEHAKADDSSVDEQAAGDGHDHSLYADDVGVSENDGEGYLLLAIFAAIALMEAALLSYFFFSYPFP